MTKRSKFPDFWIWDFGIHLTFGFWHLDFSLPDYSFDQWDWDGNTICSGCHVGQAGQMAQGLGI
jgi:hypothetical protein